MKKFMVFRIVLGCLGLILFLWFFVPGVLTANFHIGVVTGVIIALIMIAYATFADPINKFIKILWDHVAGKILIFAVLAAAAAILVLAIMCMVSMGQGMRRTGEHTDESRTVVVLGCRVYSYGPSLMLMARLDAAYELLIEDENASCIVCGGQGKNEPESEALAMYDYLISRGIEPSRIYMDDTSEDTMENLINAAQIIDNNGLSTDCAIVTSDYHCYRALKYAERLGYEEPSSIPAGTLWWIFPSAYVREMYGILEMWFIA